MLMSGWQSAVRGLDLADTAFAQLIRDVRQHLLNHSFLQARCLAQPGSDELLSVQVSCYKRQ